MLSNVFAVSNPDEGRYAEIPREMVASGDYVTPRLNGVVYFEKPPLVYWTTAVCLKLFGPSEWSMRATPALFALAGVLLTYGAARRLLLGSAHPGMTLAIIAGAWAISLNPSYYLKEGWMIAKLAAAALAVASTVVLSVAAKRINARPGATGERALRLWRGIFMGAVAAALLFVFVKPL
ncbi:MAG: glycosyltransferase family 39 protein [Elusimicrobia bacterium]|nr:glycosyltransferase family 39 protein [Elusimicrobiota bacterium]